MKLELERTIQSLPFVPLLLKATFKFSIASLCNWTMITLGLFAKVLFHTHPMQALFSIPMSWLWYAHLSQCLCVKQRICKKNYSNAVTCDEKLHKLKAYRMLLLLSSMKTLYPFTLYKTLLCFSLTHYTYFDPTVKSAAGLNAYSTKVLLHFFSQACPNAQLKCIC